MSASSSWGERAGGGEGEKREREREGVQQLKGVGREREGVPRTDHSRQSMSGV